MNRASSRFLTASRAPIAERKRPNEPYVSTMQFVSPKSFPS